MVVGLALLVVEPTIVIFAVRGDGPRAALRLLVLPGLALLGWAAGVRFRAHHGDSDARREVSELPLLHVFLLFVELVFLALPVALLS